MDLARSTSLRCRRAAAAVLAALITFAAVPSTALAGGGHLYVQSGTAILRYPLTNGIPAATPDLSIPNYGGQIAVGPDGTLYALRIVGSSPNAYVIYAFNQNQPAPYRSVVLPHQSSCSLTQAPIEGLTVDANGYLFVLVVYSLSGAHVRSPVRYSDAFPICNGVAVFPPNAKGKAPPLQAIPLSSFFFGGFSVNNREELYVALSDSNQTDEFANALKNPRQTRVLTQPNPTTGVATDNRGNVYLFDLHASSSFIDIFVPSWRSGPPTKTIDVAAPYNVPAAFAVRNQFAYLSIAGQSGVVAVYRVTATGPQNPVATLPVADLRGPMAVGP